MSNQGFIIPLDGAQGPQGEPGDDGASAYDIAVANGFVGDEAAWLASLVGADGEDGIDGNDGAPGAAGAAGPNTVTTSTTTNLTGILRGDGSNVATATIGAGLSFSSGTLKSGPYPIQVALSGVGALITSGTKKGGARVPIAGTITSFEIACSPSDEPSAAAVQVDLNKVDLSTGTATSVLSAVAQIATGANAGSGTINGTQTVAVGDWLQFDVDQGSDGALLTGTVYITP